MVNGKIIEVKNKSKDVKTNNYDYLIKMSLYSFTEDEIDRLNKEYDKSKLNAISGVVVVRVSIEPNIGPTHGVQPAANASPKTNDNG